VKRWLCWLVATVVLTATWFLWPRHTAVVESTVTVVTESATGPASAVPVGDRILRDYGQPHTTPENDLTQVARLIENYLLLVKNAGTRPLAVNADFAAAFRGMNPAQERFLSDEHPALNDAGELVDRWGSPLFFHALGGGRYEVRSAGPDRTMWTTDDIHRSADGTFRRGADLNPPSLLPN
jgi:hypothetical protein